MMPFANRLQKTEPYKVSKLISVDSFSTYQLAENELLYTITPFRTAVEPQEKVNSDEVM